MSDDKILKQFDNDAYVIGYEPGLRYDKKRTATGEVTTSETTDDTDTSESSEEQLSKTVDGFLNNMPSTVLADLDYVLKNISELKKKLANAFNNDQKNKDSSHNDINSEETVNPNAEYSNNMYHLINSDDRNFNKKFASEYDTINGSVIPSLINYISDIEDNLINLDKTTKLLYYNNGSISLQEAKELDKAYADLIRSYESKGNFNKINYLTLSYDGLLNKSMSHCIYQNNKSAIRIAKIINSNEQVQVTSNDMNLITKMFSELNDELLIRSKGYMKNENNELVQKSLYNYYEKRKNLNDIFNLYSKNPDSKLLGMKKVEYSNELTNAIKNICKVLLYNQNYLNQISEIEKQKYNLQKISESISSNS